MKKRIGIRALSLLLALVLVSVVIVPAVSAGEEQGLSKQTLVDVGKAVNVPDHYIPPEYFMDAKPATPLPESEMINIILSEKTLNTLGMYKKTGIVEFSASALDLNAQFMKSEEYQNRFIEKNINSNDAVVLVRMPKVMYQRFLAASQNNILTLPTSHFCRFYDNLADLNSHIERKGNVLTVLPGENDATLLEKITTIPLVMETPEMPEKKTVGNGITQATATDNGIWFNEWIHFNRAYWWITYDYCIGQITPNHWSFSGQNNQYYAPQEREYYLNDGQDAIEVVVNYDRYTANGKVYLFPAIYDDHSLAPTPLPQWENSGAGIIELSPSSFPHAYGYHVQISNGKYYITFEDMNTLQWFAGYVYNDQDNPSTSFTRASGSSEHYQASQPVTDQFIAYTNPVIDEWARETGGTWRKPRGVWNFNEQTPNERFVHIDWTWGGSNNQNLVTRSYLDYRWA